MAQYKVPQDVEAEDKLIGPFSFRQFLYLGVVALCVGVAVGLWQLFPGLIIIPLPFAVLFLVLALPLRKDQPMETYLTAVIRFFMKPHKRLWQPEGSFSLITIVAPKTPEVQLTKSIGGDAAAAQLGYLARVVDTQGWATRGVIAPSVSIDDTAYAEAQQAEDILDENAEVSRTFDSMIDKTSDSYKQSVATRFRQAVSQPGRRAPAQVPQRAAPTDDTHTSTAPSISSRATSPQDQPHIDYNPYPSSMHQHVLNPINDDDVTPLSPYSPQDTSGSSAQTAATPSREEVSPDIMRLANNNDLSISAIANEAHRLEAKDNEEVVINLH